MIEMFYIGKSHKLQTSRRIRECLVHMSLIDLMAVLKWNLKSISILTELTPTKGTATQSDTMLWDFRGRSSNKTIGVEPKSRLHWRYSLYVYNRPAKAGSLYGSVRFFVCAGHRTTTRGLLVLAPFSSSFFTFLRATLLPTNVHHHHHRTHHVQAVVRPSKGRSLCLPVSHPSAWPFSLQHCHLCRS